MIKHFCQIARSGYT